MRIYNRNENITKYDRLQSQHILRDAKMRKVNEKFMRVDMTKYDTK